ncbi:phosphotransferase [Kitasatospora sp. NPDC002227]|uniref:phosphotransferase family protein n=1 Tax=Kitasatospora sp. NPDC002227 TaxID=3154773 RepID=UPI00332420BF
MTFEQTEAWVRSRLAEGEEIETVEPLLGGWTSEMRRITVGGPAGRRVLVLRSFVKPFFVEHAPGLLRREADILRLLVPTEVPVAELVAVDPTGEHCDHPSLLMTLLPGGLRLADPGISRPLARQLAAVHRIEPAERPREYQAWTAPELVRVPERTTRPALWRAAVDVIRREPPAYRGVFLHRDFHPGNVLFTGSRISGVVDWVETSWGPADLDVAHCSTNLALLHGVPAGTAFAEHYTEAGGRLTPDPDDHRYWRLLDALALAPDAAKVVVPWRTVGRPDLTDELVAARMEDYLAALLA